MDKRAPIVVFMFRQRTSLECKPRKHRNDKNISENQYKILKIVIYFLDHSYVIYFHSFSYVQSYAIRRYDRDVEKFVKGIYNYNTENIIS